MASRNSPALRRLMLDQQELQESSVTNVSAAPLDSDMFEWHCNIQQDDKLFHLILYFPQNYPYSSPSAEFVPSGFNYTQGATKRGKKANQICLSIFSDFATHHKEWAMEKGSGWSPGYTAQTVLLNVVSLMAESNMTTGRHAKAYQKLCQSFTCKDCGHSFKEPFPHLEPVNQTPNKNEKQLEDSKVHQFSSEGDEIAGQIVDYISKEKFVGYKRPSDSELFGYGLVVTSKGRRAFITTPCEFLTSSSFKGMKKSVGVIHSVMKEELSYFLPLYINKMHGSSIRREFQKMLVGVKSILFPNRRGRTNFEDIVLELIPNLMSSTVVEFSKGSQHASDNSLNGYFALHRLFIWAIDTYPELEGEIESRLSRFVSNPEKRNKDCCPDIRQWFMLLSVSKRFSWKSVAGAYLPECYKRDVMRYLKSDKTLGNMELPCNERLQRTFDHTSVSRNLLTFQVAFLRMAKPEVLTTDQIIDRYEMNHGFPTAAMVSDMKNVCNEINKSEINNYGAWYNALGLDAPSKKAVFETLKESVRFANSTEGYFFTQRY